MFKAVKQFFLRLFGKSAEQAPVQPKSGRKLTRAERKEIEAVIAASKRNDRKELSAQDSIPYVTHSGEGEGLMFYGNVILPFVDRFPKDTELYQIMTTKLSEITREGG